MTIHTSVLKVDTGRTISADDDLELQIRVSEHKKAGNNENKPCRTTDSYRSQPVRLLAGYMFRKGSCCTAQLGPVG